MHHETVTFLDMDNGNNDSGQRQQTVNVVGNKIEVVGYTPSSNGKHFASHGG